MRRGDGLQCKVGIAPRAKEPCRFQRLREWEKGDRGFGKRATTNREISPRHFASSQSTTAGLVDEVRARSSPSAPCSGGSPDEYQRIDFVADGPAGAGARAEHTVDEAHRSIIGVGPSTRELASVMEGDYTVRRDEG